MNTHKFSKPEIYEGLQVSQDLLKDPGYKSLREFIKDVVRVEILSDIRIVFSTRRDRLVLFADQWILKNKEGRFQIVSPEELEKDFEIIKQ